MEWIILKCQFLLHPLSTHSITLLNTALLCYNIQWYNSVIMISFCCWLPFRVHTGEFNFLLWRWEWKVLTNGTAKHHKQNYYSNCRKRLLHGHADIVEQEEYLMWRLNSMSHWNCAHNSFLQEFTVLSGSPWASVCIQLALSRVPYQ